MMTTSLFKSRLVLGTVVLAASLSFAGAIEDSQKLVKDGKFDDAIALLEKGNTKQPAVAKALAAAHLAKADYFMFNSQDPPMRKYPTALREYRKVLEYDKTNKKAQENAKTIEDIYKGMGREVPK
jgi:tetratricopeptide (TPR) repeat protein